MVQALVYCGSMEEKVGVYPLIDGLMLTLLIAILLLLPFHNDCRDKYLTFYFTNHFFATTLQLVAVQQQLFLTC